MAADEIIRKQFENTNAYKRFTIEAVVKSTNMSGRIAVGMDFRFNQLRQVLKV